MCFCLGLDGPVFFVVLRVVGAADLVPEIVVDAEILLVILVVQVVVRGRVEYLLDRVIEKVLVPELVGGVAPHVDVEHEAVEHPDPEHVRRDRKGDDVPEGPLDHGLDGVEREGGKRCGRERAMVDHVEGAQPFPLVHPAMGPVEPGVVGKLDEEKVQQEIRHATLIPTGVDQRVTGLPEKPETESHDPEDDLRGEGVTNLTPDLRGSRRGRMDRAMGNGRAKEAVEEPPPTGGKQQEVSEEESR